MDQYTYIYIPGVRARANPSIPCPFLSLCLSYSITLHSRYPFISLSLARVRALASWRNVRWYIHRVCVDSRFLSRSHNPVFSAPLTSPVLCHLCSSVRSVLCRDQAFNLKTLTIELLFHLKRGLDVDCINNKNYELMMYLHLVFLLRVESVGLRKYNIDYELFNNSVPKFKVGYHYMFNLFFLRMLNSFWKMHILCKVFNFSVQIYDFYNHYL